MATFTKINDWALYAGAAANLSTDQFTVYLSNTLPSSETSDPSADGNGVIANVTQISYTNLSSRNITTSSWTQTGGVASLVFNDLTLTSTGASTGPFQYVYIGDSTVAGTPLVGYYDYGSPLTITDGGSLLIDFTNAAPGFWQLTVS